MPSRPISDRRDDPHRRRRAHRDEPRHGWRAAGRPGAAGWVALWLFLSVLPVQAAETIRVCLVGANASALATLGPLQAALTRSSGLQCILLATSASSAGGPRTLGPLRTAHAAVFLHGPGSLAPEDATILQEFLRAGKGSVILGAIPAAWTAAPEFVPGMLGATPAALFASGAPMTVINLFPHPIFAGVPRFETNQPMASFGKLADDAEMIMEGTVGEDTTPLAWVRRRPTGRLCHLVPATPAVLNDPAYVRLVANAVRWTCRQPIPGAQPSVQRTFMPDSLPGAIAITFPNGPGVCLDPVRGGINYLWDGDFVDLRPRWLTKQGEPARIFGPVFYREKTWRPLRVGTPTREPAYQFRGYTLREDGPEFHYEIDGREVHETILAAPDGQGILRRFRVGAGPGPLWLNLDPQSGADVTLRGLERDGDIGCFPSPAAGEFTIEIHRRAGGTKP